MKSDGFRDLGLVVTQTQICVDGLLGLAIGLSVRAPLFA
jgi:hypothetical protein